MGLGSSSSRDICMCVTIRRRERRLGDTCMPIQKRFGMSRRVSDRHDFGGGEDAGDRLRRSKSVVVYLLLLSCLLPICFWSRGRLVGLIGVATFDPRG